VHNGGLAVAITTESKTQRKQVKSLIIRGFRPSQRRGLECKVHFCPPITGSCQRLIAGSRTRLSLAGGSGYRRPSRGRKNPGGTCARLRHGLCFPELYAPSAPVTRIFYDAGMIEYLVKFRSLPVVPGLTSSLRHKPGVDRYSKDVKPISLGSATARMSIPLAELTLLLILTVVCLGSR